jgi:hypothetical protein
MGNKLPCDIARCNGFNCILRDKCLRYVSESSHCRYTNNISALSCKAKDYEYFISRLEDVKNESGT